jgi:hypothetical protein
MYANKSNELSIFQPKALDFLNNIEYTLSG